MQKPSLIALYAFHLSKYLNSSTNDNGKGILIVLDQVLLLIEVNPSLFNDQKSENDLSFLISALCTLLKDKKFPPEYFTKSLKVINEIVSVNSTNVAYLFRITPGVASSLFHFLVVKNNLSVISASLSIEAIKLFFLFVRNAFLMPAKTLEADKKPIIKLQNATSALFLKVKVLGSTSAAIVDTFFECLTDLFVHIPEQFCDEWLKFGIVWLATLSKSISIIEILEKSIQKLSSSQSIVRNICKIQSNILNSETDLTADQLQILQLSICISKHDQVFISLFLKNNSKGFVNVKFQKVFSSISCNYPSNYRFPLFDQVFAVQNPQYLVAKFIPIENVDQALFDMLSEDDADRTLTSLYFLNIYASNTDCVLLEPFVDFICQKGLYLSNEKVLSSSLVFLGAFLSRVSDADVFVSNLLYPVLLNVGSTNRIVSDLSMSVLILITQRLCLESVENMLEVYLDSILSSLSISIKFKRSNITQICIVLINLFKFLKSKMLSFFNDTSIFLLERLASIHTKKDFEQEAYLILSVLEEYFKVHSAVISSHKSLNTLDSSAADRSVIKTNDSEDMTTTQSCALKILQMTRNFIFKDDLRLQNIAIRLLKSSLVYLSTISKQFLPTIHDYWDALLKRLPKAHFDVVGASVLYSKASITAVVETITILCHLASDFVAERVCREIIPHLKNIASFVSLNCVFELVLAMIENFNPLKDRFLREIFYFLANYEHQHRIASDSIRLLSAKYPTSMWFYLNCCNAADTIMVPNSLQSATCEFSVIDFSIFSFNKAPKINSESAEFYLNVINSNHFSEKPL